MKRALAASVLTSVLLSGCASDGAAAWIAEVEAASADAEAAERAGDRGAARDALQRIVTLEAPDDVAAEDARVVRQDAYARLGELQIDAGDPRSALASARAGLALGERDDLFTANLLAVAGRAHEVRGEDREAAREYHRALVIHETLLELALGGEP